MGHGILLAVIISWFLTFCYTCIFILFTAQSQSESVGIHQDSHEGDVTHSEQQTG